MDEGSPSKLSLIISADILALRTFTKYSATPLDDRGGIPIQRSRMPFTAQAKPLILEYCPQTGSFTV